MELWSASLTTLREAGATESQIEAVRRVGARRRHEARVSEARQEIASIADDVYRSTHEADRSVVEGFIGAAIRGALHAIGQPGSSRGTAPPGWYRDHPHVAARAAAMHEVLAHVAGSFGFVPSARSMQDAGIGVWAGDMARPSHYVTAREGHVEIVRDDEDCTVVAEVSSAAHPVLSEHLVATAIAERAHWVDAWLLHPSGPCPVLPDAGACEEHARLVAARRPAPASEVAS